MGKPFMRELTVTWDGESVQITPTMQLMSQIEASGISVLYVISERMAGRTPIFLVARLVALLLQSARVRVTEEEVFDALRQGDATAVHSIVDELVLSLYPPKEEDDDEAKTGASKEKASE